MRFINKLSPSLKYLAFAESDNVFIQYARYIVVGGSAFVVDFGLLYVFTEFLNINYLISAALSFAIALVFNYIWSLWWIFNSSDSQYTPAMQFVMYAVIGVVGIILNEAIIYFNTEHLGFYYLYSKLISGALVFTVNFLLRRYLIFSSKIEVHATS